MDENDSDDYELLPHGQIEQLRKELMAAKKNPLREGSGKDLHDAITKLDSSISKLVSILEDAQQDIIEEYQESKPIEKLNQILDQNETIARALISINDKLGGVATPGKDNNDNTNNSDTQNDSGINFNDAQFMPPPQPMPSMQQNQISQFQPPLQQNQKSSQQQNFPAPSLQNQQSFQQPNYPPPSFQQPPVYQPPQLAMQPMQQPAMQNQPQMMPVRVVQRQQNLPVNDLMPPSPFQPPDIPFGNLPPLDSTPIPGTPMPIQDPNMLPEHKRKKFLGIM